VSNAKWIVSCAWPASRVLVIVAVSLIVQLQVFLDNAFADGPPRWGVVAYLSGEGGLETEAEGYWSTILTSAKAGEYHTALQIDGPDVCGRWSAAAGEEPVFTPLGRVNMGSGEEFASFITWALEEVDSERNLLIVMGHGSGLATQQPDLCGVAFDGSEGDSLTVRELADGLRAARERKLCVETVCLDTCYGASFEAACDLQGLATYLVASPGRVLSPGLPWPRILPELDLYMDGRQLAISLLTHHDGSLVGVDLTAVAEVSESFSSLVHVLYSNLCRVAPTVRFLRSRTPSWGHRDEMCDMLRFMQELSTLALPDAIASNAETVASNLALAMIKADPAVAANVDTRPSTLGLFFPSTWERVPSHYRDAYEMPRTSGWADFLELYYECAEL
jgi:hypothetical protein